MFGHIGPPWWDDRPVAIVGTGPSLKGFDVERLRGFHVLAVKGAIFDIPWADAGFGLDGPRFLEWKPKLSQCAFPIYWAFSEAASASYLKEPPSNVTFLKRLERCGLSDDPGAIEAGGTSGYGAMNTVYLKRAKVIGLFGFDYRPNGKHEDEWHANETHYRARRDQNQASWQVWAGNFKGIAEGLHARGVSVINACPSSWITAFPRKSIDETLVHLDRLRSA